MGSVLWSVCCCCCWCCWCCCACGWICGVHPLLSDGFCPCFVYQAIPQCRSPCEELPCQKVRSKKPSGPACLSKPTWKLHKAGASGRGDRRSRRWREPPFAFQLDGCGALGHSRKHSGGRSESGPGGRRDESPGFRCQDRHDLRRLQRAVGRIKVHER